MVTEYPILSKAFRFNGIKELRKVLNSLSWLMRFGSEWLYTEEQTQKKHRYPLRMPMTHKIPEILVADVNFYKTRDSGWHSIWKSQGIRKPHLSSGHTVFEGTHDAVRIAFKYWNSIIPARVILANFSLNVSRKHNGEQYLQKANIGQLQFIKMKTILTKLLSLYKIIRRLETICSIACLNWTKWPLVGITTEGI